MNRQSLLFVLLVAGSSIAAIAADGTAASSRYEADKKLCAEEANSGARMQCLRDAKAEYDKALAAAKATDAIDADYKAARDKAAARYEADRKRCAEESSSGVRMQCLRDAKAEYTKSLAAAEQKMLAARKARESARNCVDCGKVVAVATAKKEGKGGALGTIGGGVAGALLGHQVGGGKGKDLATVAGAVGGAYAGYKAEEKLRSTTVWSVTVRMDSGAQRVIEFDHDPGFANGDLVKVSGNTITRR